MKGVESTKGTEGNIGTTVMTIMARSRRSAFARLTSVNCPGVSCCSMSGSASMSIPTIDVAPFFTGPAEQRQRVVAAVGAALAEYGCMTLVGHGVAPELIEHVHDEYREFFNGTPEHKQACAPDDRSWLRGFYSASALDSSTAQDARRATDLREMYMSCRATPLPDAYVERLGPIGLHVTRGNIWPEGQPSLRTAAENYYEVMERLAATIMQICALALELPQHYFDDKIDCHHSGLIAANYYEQTQPPSPGQLRCGAHSDYGSLTILHQNDAPGGLQIQRPDGSWIDVKPVANGLVINLGDTMREWTNGRWKSPVHRVVNPPRELAASSRRQTLLFFHCPNYDSVLELIPSCADPDAPADGPRPTVGEIIARKSMEAMKTAAG